MKKPEGGGVNLLTFLYFRYKKVSLLKFTISWLTSHDEDDFLKIGNKVFMGINRILADHRPFLSAGTDCYGWAGGYAVPRGRGCVTAQ